MNTQLTTTSQINLALTMNSQEIGDLVESRHDSVKLCIERLALRGVIQLPPMAEVKNHLGQTVSVYQVGKRDSYVVVAQLCPEFTARLVDRWQELEGKVATQVMPIPQTMAQALRLAADQAEQIERQQAQLAIAAPKAAFVDQYVDSTGLKGFREVAKLLEVKEPWFREFLTDRKIMYRLGREWHAHQRHIDAKRFAVKTGTSEISGHTFNRSMFTPKGIEWIAGLIASERVSSVLKASHA